MLFAAPIAALGQPSPTPASGASPAPATLFSPEQEASAGYYKLMLDMAGATQASSVGDKQVLRDKLITIYERLVELYCMPDLMRTLEHAADPAGAECLEYIARLGELHPDNPVLLCAKHGIDSDLCKNAYLNQYIDVYQLEDLDPSELDLKTKIKAELSEKDIRQLSAEVDTMRFRYERDAAEAQGDKTKAEALRKQKKELDGFDTKLLNLACKIVRIKIVRTAVDDSKKIGSIKKPEPKGDPLRELVREFTDVNVRATPKAPEEKKNPAPGDLDFPFAAKKKAQEQQRNAAPFWRVRYLTADCMKYIQNVQKYDPQLPAVACNLEGETSPHCIAMLREWRHIQQAPVPGQRPKQMGGFSTF